MKRLTYLFIGFVVVLFGITFAIKNPQVVELHYYFGLEWKGSVALIMIVVLAIGTLLGYLAGLKTIMRMRRDLQQARKEVRQVEQEVKNLRALPIKDEL